MNTETCAVLAGVFPLLLIAIVTDRRAIHLKLRVLSWYRASVVISIAACGVGLGAAVVGVQNSGYGNAWGSVVWFLFAVPLVVFLTSIVMNVATLESEEDGQLKSEQDAKTIQLF